MGLVAVLAAFTGLVSVPGVGVHGRDHPVRRRRASNAPPPVGAIGVLGRLHVLACDQRQQRHRLRRPAARGLDCLGVQRVQQRQGVADQHADQLVPGGRVVPRDTRLARLGVVLPSQHNEPGALTGDQGLGAGHLPADPTDLGDQLGDSVLTGNRVIEDRGVQRPPLLPGQHPRLRDHLPHHLEDALRPLRGGQPTPPVRQRRRVKPHRIHGVPAGGLPPQIERHRIGGLPIRAGVQGLPVRQRSVAAAAAGVTARLLLPQRQTVEERCRGPQPPRPTVDHAWRTANRR
jgi:hypothetical protein